MYLEVGTSLYILYTMSASAICKTPEPTVTWLKSTINPIFLETENPVIEAVKMSGNAQLVCQLLDAGFHGNDCDKLGRNALHWAIEYGHEMAAMLLIDSGYTDLDTQDHKGQTPLFLACKGRRCSLARCLVESGCDVTKEDVAGNTALHKAVLTSLEPEMNEIVETLCLSGSDTNYENHLGCTPFHDSLRTGNAAVVATLISNGADVLRTPNNKMVPFLSAIFYYKIAQQNTYRDLDAILKILIENGCQLSRGHGQWSPLSACVNIEDTQIADMLIVHGCRLDSPIALGRSNLVEIFAKCEPHVVKLYVMAGYHITDDDLVQCAKRVPSFSKSFLRLSFPGLLSCRHHVNTLTWLKHRSKTPFSLTELSRYAIRTCLNHATGDTSILAAIRNLPLPVCMRRFISLGDCIDMLPNNSEYAHFYNFDL